jgi:hypothetical protein
MPGVPANFLLAEIASSLKREGVAKKMGDLGGLIHPEMVRFHPQMAKFQNGRKLHF